MGGRRDYTRWDYDDETEITMEEQLTLEENSSLGGGPESLCNATFPPPNVMSSSSPIRSRESGKRCRKTSIKEKAQLFVLSAGVLLVGFMTGFGIGVRDRGTQITSRHSKHFSSISDPTSASSQSHEHNDLIFHELLHQISAENIRNNLKRMTQEEHRAGTPEGRSMAIAVRDLWRSYGISVRVEQHKTLLTKTESFNFVEVISKNGSTLFTTSKIGDDVNLPNSRPIVAFSPPANLNGTLVYGHYGTLEDFQRLRKSGLILKGAIALLRFGSLSPSNVALNAIAFGLGGLVFYPDPQDFGPQLPSIAIRRSSLLSVGQVHDYQKRKGNRSIPSHTISAKDAERLFGAMEGTEKVPPEWEGGLKTNYYLGGSKPDGEGLVRLKISNEVKMSSIYNVVAAIPGSIESDRYVIIGCSHDSWSGSGAGDPGIGLAMTTELLRAFSSSLATGWKPRRSILIISWDANLFASSGVSHWLQEHHFEIGNRAIAYIDMTRALKGNQTLEIFSSPLLKEVTRKAINRIKHSGGSSAPKEELPSNDEPAFAFLGNLGIPFIRLCVSNAPKDYNYPLYHTAFDTFDNFAKLVDPDFGGSEALGRIIAEIIVLLADSSALPITLHDYIKEIRKEFDHFTAEYHDDFHKANLSYAMFQAAVMRLEVTADNFKSQSKNHSVKENSNSLAIPHRKLRREMHHRILNDKLISVEKALLTRNSDSNDGYKHQIIGYTSSSIIPEIPLVGKYASTAEPKPQEDSHLVKKSTNLVNTSRAVNFTSAKHTSFHSEGEFSSEHFPSSPHFFPKLRAVLDCGRSCEAGLNNGDTCTDFYLFSTSTQPASSGMTSESNNNHGTSKGSKSASNNTTGSCLDWRSVASQRISSLVRSLDSVSAIIQSPLVAQPLHE